jgi:hypothetical protein
MAVRPQRGSIFHLIMIKPSHYGDDGYPIQWLRSAIPSNTLACLNGIAEDCAARNVLGEGVELRIEAYDETNRLVRPARIMRQIERDGGKALIAMIGVQSNQYPRALDLARPFREKGFPVCIGGFHVSGCISMLDDLHVTLQEAQALGISLFAGEAEDGRLDEVLQDAYRGELKPLYNHMKDLPDLANQPIPMLPLDHIRRYAGSTSSVDLGRGCPFQCSFCTIINVQGRKSRFRTVDDLELIIRQNAEQGIHRFLITDDNFARNRNWEGFFDRMIWLRESEGLRISLTIQVDTLCHKIDRFIDKAKRAGVNRAFIGLENINPDSLIGAKKRQNKITDYRRMLQDWKRAGVITYAGYIIGFPNDTKETIRRDIEIIKRELPIDILEFFILTPLPGSEDHKVLYNKGVWMDPDMNKYDTNHVVTEHPLMSKAELEEAYRDAWLWFFTPQHMETVMRRAAACGVSAGKVMFMMLWFFFSIRHARVHPLDGGYFRLRFRKDRRPGVPRETMLRFYPRYLFDIVHNHFWMGYWLLHMGIVRQRLRYDKSVPHYTDLSLTAPQEDEYDDLALFGATRGGQAAVAKRLKEDTARQALHAMAVL